MVAASGLEQLQTELLGLKTAFGSDLHLKKSTTERAPFPIGLSLRVEPPPAASRYDVGPLKAVIKLSHHILEAGSGAAGGAPISKTSESSSGPGVAVGNIQLTVEVVSDDLPLALRSKMSEVLFMAWEQERAKPGAATFCLGAIFAAFKARFVSLITLCPHLLESYESVDESGATVRRFTFLQPSPEPVAPEAPPHAPADIQPPAAAASTSSSSPARAPAASTDASTRTCAAAAGVSKAAPNAPAPDAARPKRQQGKGSSEPACPVLSGGSSPQQHEVGMPGRAGQSSGAAKVSAPAPAPDSASPLNPSAHAFVPSFAPSYPAASASAAASAAVARALAPARGDQQSPPSTATPSSTSTDGSRSTSGDRSGPCEAHKRSQLPSSAAGTAGTAGGGIAGGGIAAAPASAGENEGLLSFEEAAKELQFLKKRYGQAIEVRLHRGDPAAGQGGSASGASSSASSRPPPLAMGRPQLNPQAALAQQVLQPGCLTTFELHLDPTDPSWEHPSIWIVGQLLPVQEQGGLAQYMPSLGVSMACRLPAWLRGAIETAMAAHLHQAASAPPSSSPAAAAAGAGTGAARGATTGVLRGLFKYLENYAGSIAAQAQQARAGTAAPAQQQHGIQGKQRGADADVDTGGEEEEEEEGEDGSGSESSGESSGDESYDDDGYGDGDGRNYSSDSDGGEWHGSGRAQIEEPAEGGDDDEGGDEEAGRDEVRFSGQAGEGEGGDGTLATAGPSGRRGGAAAGGGGGSIVSAYACVLEGLRLDGVDVAEVIRGQFEATCGRCSHRCTLTLSSDSVGGQEAQGPGPVPSSSAPAASGRHAVTTCTNCHAQVGLLMRPHYLTDSSNVLCVLKALNCTPLDLLPSWLAAQCTDCGSVMSLRGLQVGMPLERGCGTCHHKLCVNVAAVSFIKRGPPPGSAGAASTSGKGSRAGQGPSTVSAYRSGAGGRGHTGGGGGGMHSAHTVLRAGEPLPANGTCKHYKHSYRWLRFPCCGMRFACDLCHEEGVADGHPARWASRMVCGFCSTEQPLSLQCGACGRKVAGKARNPLGRATRFWEGGDGCRDTRCMNRNDPHKHKGKHKTKSAKSSRVGPKAYSKEAKKAAAA